MYFRKRIFTNVGVAAALLVPLISLAATLEECNAAYKSVDYAKGTQFFQAPAEKGDAMAQYHLGFMYMTRDLGKTEDYAQAAKWYRKAAEQGNSCAQNGLGILYSNGHSVPKDASEAARWYRRAADQGHSMAQYNLGVLYREGHGVTKDEVEAARWFQKAADQGNEAARKALLRLGTIRQQ